MAAMGPPRSPTSAHARGGKTFFHLKMPSRREAVAVTAERVVLALRTAGLGADQLSNLTVALTEALSNGVVHGNRLRVDRPVLVAGCIDAARGVVIDVRDFGAGFAVAGLVDPCSAERVLAPSGRGILMMRHLVDDVTFNRRGNRVRLALRLRAAG